MTMLLRYFRVKYVGPFIGMKVMHNYRDYTVVWIDDMDVVFELEK